jgi:hypothetical protein
MLFVQFNSLLFSLFTFRVMYEHKSAAYSEYSVEQLIVFGPQLFTTETPLHWVNSVDPDQLARPLKSAPHLAR